MSEPMCDCDYYLHDDACPNCGAKLDHATERKGARPRPGDYSICIRCAAPLRFDSALRLTLLDLAAIEREHLEVIVAIQATILTAHRSRPVVRA